jgi:hypothetical protein
MNFGMDDVTIQAVNERMMGYVLGMQDAATKLTMSDPRKQQQIVIPISNSLAHCL